MNVQRVKALGIAALWLAGAVSAHAGGFERSSQDFDILFEPGTVIDTTGTVVMPERKLKNIRANPGVPLPPIVLYGPDTGRPMSSSVDEGKTFWVPKVSAKYDLTDDLACAVQYREPWGIHTDVGLNTFRSYTAIEQKITSRDFGINCSYRIPVGEKGYFRILGGVSYQELKGYQSKLVPPGTPFGGTFRVATLDVEDRGVGWRIGGAYELPEYALRATLVYQSEVKYNLDGTISNLAPIPLNVNGDVAAPQSVEFKFQTGIAPDWLAMASVKWTDWKSIQSIAFTSVNNTAVGLPNGRKITSLDLYYRDGWTIMGGIGHKFNEKWSGAATVTWDRGTSTGWTSQTNLWLFGLAADFKPQKHLSFRLAGAVGWLGSGTLKDTVSTSDFGNDLVTALSLTAKVKF